MVKCLECKEPIVGRSDKLFCNANCKSAYHYQKNRESERPLFKKIDLQLKLNRRLLKRFNASGKSVIRKEEFLAQGFDPKYFTHYWKNQKGEVYLFCYEFGFLSTKENGKNKYVLVKWQDYMR